MSTHSAGPEIERLIALLAKLPGLGPRSARRVALHLLKKRDALMSPLATTRMLQARYSSQQWQQWQRANEAVRARQQAYDDGMIEGTIAPVYKFDHGVLHDSDIEMDAQLLSIGGQEVRLDRESPYGDMKFD